MKKINNIFYLVCLLLIVPFGIISSFYEISFDNIATSLIAIVGIFLGIQMWIDAIKKDKAV